MAFTTRLFVGNLPDDLNENALRKVFSSYGDITNFDLKTKPGTENDKKKFAFITLSASNFNIELCIKHFSNEDFFGNKLYVTRARESFLERLQREREQSNKKELEKIGQTHTGTEGQNKTENLNFQKRKFNDESSLEDKNFPIKKSKVFPEKSKDAPIIHIKNNEHDSKKDKKNNLFLNDEKKQNSDIKRLESMKKKRQEFNEKKNIIKSGLISIDKKPNKKVIFSDTEDNVIENHVITNNNSKSNINGATNLFDDEASDEEINFEIKEQFEGKKGQRVLDLQSRYKSDKRFVLDDRFVEDESDKEDNTEQDQVDLEQADEKSKQLNILQDVLGIQIKTKYTDSPSNKTKAKLGMLRFDPMQPDHAKYLAPVEVKQESTKKSKKKKLKDKEEEEQIAVPEPVVEKVEVSKEQFYKISDTLKEAITQPNAFSLRSLFSKDDTQHQETQQEQEKDYISLKPRKDSKVKNPLDLGEKNPFVYDSSESENEDDEKIQDTVPEMSETKTVWREKLFFSSDDFRLKDALLFFNKKDENERNKDRRELKSLMKKRIYNKERKNTMFQKKIGGRKKMMKKKFKKNK